MKEPEFLGVWILRALCSNQTSTTLKLTERERMNPIYKVWTKKEIDYLIKYYSEYLVYEIAEHLGRTEESIQQKAALLGLKKGVSYSRAERDYLIASGLPITHAVLSCIQYCKAHKIKLVAPKEKAISGIAIQPNYIGEKYSRTDTRHKELKIGEIDWTDYIYDRVTLQRISGRVRCYGLKTRPVKRFTVWKDDKNMIAIKRIA